MGYGQYTSNGNSGRGAGLIRVPAARTKRKRTVWPEDDVAKLWATQAQDSARNSRGNFYFRGDTIYSYGGHFPIAVLTSKQHNGKRVVLYTNKGYSVTTAGHKATVRGACHAAGFVLCEVPNIVASMRHQHEQNYKALLDAYQAALAKAKRAREHKPWALEAAERDRINLCAYRELFLPRQRSLTVAKPSNLKAEIEAAENTAEQYRKLAQRREAERRARHEEQYFADRLQLAHELVQEPASV